MLLVSARKKKTPATSTRKGCQICTCYQRNSVVPDAKIVHIRRSFPIRSMNIGGNSTFVATPVPSRVIPSSVITGIEFFASLGREAPSIGRQKLLQRRRKAQLLLLFSAPGRALNHVEKRRIYTKPNPRNTSPVSARNGGAAQI